ncbi:MAG: arginyltransferase, partial [Pirellulales bacterium]|nr:arginyltransferase [Pirellulales bacterium]
IGISIVDVGAESTSAVYTHFEPGSGRYSLGTYAVLKQLQWARQTERKYVYLGMYVTNNRHLNYKARFGPQQRLIDQTWIDVDD